VVCVDSLETEETEECTIFDVNERAFGEAQVESLSRSVLSFSRKIDAKNERMGINPRCMNKNINFGKYLTKNMKNKMRRNST